MRQAMLASAFLVLLTCTTIYAEVPPFLSYQGILKDDSGEIVPDGIHEFTFRLYDVDSGGTELWTEIQSLEVGDGVFNAILGKVESIEVEFDVPYWLGVSVDGNPELTPRIEMTSVPYAAHAAYADAALNADEDWTIVGSDMHSNVIGNVGVGTSNPASPLHVARDFDGHTALTIENSNHTDNSSIGIDFKSTGGILAGMRLWGNASPVNTDLLNIFNVRPEGLISISSLGGFIVLDTEGHVGIGNSQPTTKLDVAGTVKMNGFKMNSGASAGHILTSDGTGTGTWQAPDNAGDDDWTITGDNIYHLNGNVGIGTTAPAEQLHIQDNGTPMQRIESTLSSGKVTLELKTNGDIWDYLQLAKHGPTAEGHTAFIPLANLSRLSAGANAGPLLLQVITSNPMYFVTDNTERMRLTSSGNLGIGTVSPDTRLHVVQNGGNAIHGECIHTNAADYAGVSGYSVPQDYYGIGGYFTGGYTGVYGRVNPTGSASGYIGVHGSVVGGSGTNYGVFGQASGGAVNYAGYFSGNVHVNGTMSKSGGSFKIDHPLDPANKTLSHSFVESPDMMNIYNGNVILDANGEAWVTMPDWFEALNMEFRYQLTCIGGFAQVYVAEEIMDNRFRIAGGESGLKVSWQVTGVRHDAWAEANRIQVEEMKIASEQGLYLDAAVHGMPEELDIAYRHRMADRQKLGLSSNNR